MNLRMGASTTAQTLKDIVASRLLPVHYNTSAPCKYPIGVLVEDVCTPFEELYQVLASLDDSKRKGPFTLLFSPVSSPDPSSVASSSSSDDSRNVVSTSSAPSHSIEPQPFTFQPIGYVKSCWPRKNGCPRQGILAPHACASIRLQPPRVNGSMVSALDALDGIGAFSHVWLIFVFHANQESRESPGVDAVGSGHLRAKVHPPRMGGKSIGLYATRSPHRFVPIGLTAVALERVEGDTLYLSGVDLIDGTPILDIKPYVNAYDCLTSASNTATWIGASSEVNAISFSPLAEQHLLALASLVKTLPQDSEKIKLTIAETLLADPRSVYRKQKCAGEPFGFRLDVLSVHCQVDGNTAIVTDITLHTSMEEDKEETPIEQGPN